eukprot:scaffold8194_cov118-Cylindrotheca_fusiformis.AAC.8
MSQQPPNQGHNMYYGNPGGQQQQQRPMGAWQPAAPTSLQMAQQQQQQPYGQQQQQQQRNPAGSYAVPPNMNPYAAYHNPYYAQQQAAAAQQHQQQHGQRVGGWNPTYSGTPMYQANPNMYYQQQQPQQQQQQQPKPAQAPAPRPKKALVITDKNGNPIDLTSVRKSSSSATPAAATPATKGSDMTTTKPAPAPSDAGAKLRQAALERLQAKDDTPKNNKANVVEEAKEKKLDNKTEDDKAEPEKKEEKPVDEKEKPKGGGSLSALLKKVEQKEEENEDEEKTQPEPAVEEKTPQEPAEAEEKSTKGGSLSALLAKVELKEEEAEEEVSTPQEPVVPDDPVLPKVKVSSSGKKRRVYSKEDMLRLKSLPVCIVRPSDLPEVEITKGPSRNDGGRSGGAGGGGGGGGSGGRNRGRGDGNSWRRGAPPPERSRNANADNNANNGGGGQWTRGQAPPPRQNNPNNNRKGGRGGRGSDVPFFDGPVEPLQKSKNGWRPVKDSSPLVVAEKKVKSILNKMTKEKFDRLSTQIVEIPIVSRDILTMMIHNVYEKAIDEPAFGDMYGDLCVKLSKLQNTSYVKIIQSDEEPPTEDGEDAGNNGSDNRESSTHSVYRWSNDVNSNDSEIVGPFSSPEECVDVAISDSNPERVERGDMELELHKLLIKKGMFIKVMKKKEADDNEEGQEAAFYTVFFPVAEAEDLGQQMSKIFLSERECVSDATKQNSFKRSLLNKCQDEFDKQDIYVDWKKEKKAYEESKASLSDAERAEMEEELNFRRIKIKYVLTVVNLMLVRLFLLPDGISRNCSDVFSSRRKQMLGNIKFIGQLYKKSLLKEKIMRLCISNLLKLEPIDENAKNPMYKDSGDADMDEEDHEAICSMFSTIGSTIDKPPAADFMKVSFDKISRLSKDKALPSRSRFMYKDLLDLRANNWVPRRKVEKAKTLEEIRKDVEREEKQQAQQSQQNNYRGGGGGGRRDSYGVRDSKPRNTFSSNRPRQPKPVVQTDDDGFTTIVSGNSAPKPRSSSSQRSSPQKSSGKKGSTAFAALEEEPAAPSTKKPAAEALSPEKLERRVRSIRGEYIQDPSNTTELMLSMDELSGTPDAGMMFVQLNSDRIIDCKDDERAAIYDMLTTLVEHGKLSSSDVKAGLEGLIEFIDSYVYDAPKAFDYLGEMLTAMYNAKAVDIAWICEQAEKTRDNGEDNPEKVIRALATAMESKNGKDSVRAALSSPGPVANLLGDRWDAFSKEVL